MTESVHDVDLQACRRLTNLVGGGTAREQARHPLDVLPFKEIWAVDFEFGSEPGENPEPVCLVAWELKSGRKIQQWRDQFGAAPPYPTDHDALFIAYYSSAEIGCHLALGWPAPERVLDLFTEFRNVTNGLPTANGAGLLGALAHYGLDGIGTVEKDEMRDLVLRGGPWSAAERVAVLEYCESDVAALARLLPAILPTIDLPRGLLRGRYMVAAARMERNGVPIDTAALALLRKHWTDIQDGLIAEIDRDYGVFDGRTFKANRFAAWLVQSGIPWPSLESGRLDLSDGTFREMARGYPAVAPLRELRAALSGMRLSDLAVGSDSRNRTMLSAFRARTGRNQPSNTKFIFGPSTWLRGLIRPPLGCGIAYIDWAQQEFGIAAALSGDPMMMEAYRSGDPYLPINAKSSTQDGLNPHLTVVDELHAHKDRSLFDVLRSATGARSNPLGWYITTAGYNTEGVCYEQRDYLCKVLQRVVDDDSYFGIIYTLDEGDDPFNEAVWPKANPNLNVSVDIEKLRAYAKQAKNSPASQGEFKTKRLNVWQNSHSTWLSVEQWKACADTSLKIEDFAGEPAWIGVDLADTNDVAALVIVFDRDGMLHAFSRFYLPEDLVEICAHRTTTHYRVWRDQGHIITTPGDFIDHNAIEQEIRALCEVHQVEKIRLEHYGSAQIAANLMNDGLPVEIIHKKPDSYSEPAKLLEAWVEINKFRFDGNPVLTWMASNCVVERRVNGTILPKKEHRDSPKKIDGIDALIMAIGGANVGEARSAYDGDDRAEGIRYV